MRIFMRKRSFLNYFSVGEMIRYIASIVIIISAYFIFQGDNILTLISSVIGTISLAFASKGHPVAQVLVIIFSIFYAIISYSYAYYGEMITYVFMTTPMAIIALFSWLKNPYNGKKSQVKINKINKKDVAVMIILSIIVTVIFYYVLMALKTANLVFSTISITTSFMAVFLTYKRSEFFALAYAANDLVLIVLWVLSSIEDKTCISMVICFILFLVNDFCAYLSWAKMKKMQTKHANKSQTNL